ncbi:DUF2878 domain-containing protein [Methylophaga sp. OBS1]|jgi:hypothetical protein|uniref:DUF2878 domain-containing protein n=1 Tax=Methylophaga sp. OBS1 TaxID=2991933 RepID=UPI00224D919B|nr:DUF2878 domain-containing protein [Methylophaga sp. OBS1]MCX4190887.1 DUF2878 domain-containing protein [Methylophaga sp. OBS1]MCX4192166.1 DUF2878 domain-containing protein [Methylophaga sp. OBS1]
MRNVLNFVAFQAVWLIVILAAAAGKPAYALLATATFAVVQVYFSRWRVTDIKLIVLGLLAGMMLDTIWLNMGWIGYAHGDIGGLAPWWIGCLWVNFMLTLNHSLSWLQPRLKMLGMMTVFAAPLSYLAGSKLGAVTLLEPGMAVLSLSLSWALLVPMLMCLARLWHRQEEEENHALV